MEQHKYKRFSIIRTDQNTSQFPFCGVYLRARKLPDIWFFEHCQNFVERVNSICQFAYESQVLLKNLGEMIQLYLKRGGFSQHKNRSKTPCLYFFFFPYFIYILPVKANWVAEIRTVHLITVIFISLYWCRLREREWFLTGFWIFLQQNAVIWISIKILWLKRWSC